MKVGADMLVEAVGGRAAEIGRGRVLLIPRGRYRAKVLFICRKGMAGGVEGGYGVVLIRGLR
jgi:hypothetical protein